MAYHFDSYDNSLVIDGFEKGIADSPFSGLADMRNVNIISVPGEASVNFSTSQISSPKITTSIVVTGLASNAISFTGVAGLENGMAIQFTAVGGLTGVSINTTYWVQSASGSPTTSIKLYSDFLQSVAVTITGAATGSPTFTVYNVGTGSGGSPNSAPTYFTYTSVLAGGYTFMQDGLGQVWTNQKTTTSGYWCFTGRSGTADTNAGKGLTYFEASDGTGYIFSFTNKAIDYFVLTTCLWTWGWKPSTAGINQANYLNTTGIHEAVTGPDSTVYYCDGFYIGSFFQTDPATPFVPTTASTYTFSQIKLLSTIDAAQCLAFLGTNLLIGGNNNIIYVWDRFDPFISYPIYLAENAVHRMVTVNTTTYIFVGNRGRIYQTNGSNVQLYKKLPDHISGTVEPYFTWGGATSVKNQLYFSAKCTTNAGVAINQYGGVWAIDLDTNAIRLTNQLSYASYAGFASALIPNFSTNPAGTGLYIGWDNNNFTYGIDTTSSTPYTTSVATIDSEYIPIGTFQKPREFTKVEFRLTRPLVTGESVVIKSRQIFNVQSTGYTTIANLSGTTGDYSGIGDINLANYQWCQFQVVLNSTASSPSYVRLKELRLGGMVGPTLATNQMLSI